jgi:hypothetical protein
MMPSLETHLPIIVNRHETHSRCLVWVDRLTGERIESECNTVHLPLGEWAGALEMTQADFDEMINRVDPDSERILRMMNGDKAPKPSFDTHFPMVFIDVERCEPALYWVDRETGEMIYMFDLGALADFEAVTGIYDNEEAHRDLMGGYSKEGIKELGARMKAEMTREGPEYKRLSALASAWKKEKQS